jgi:hypothetical protein
METGMTCLELERVEVLSLRRSRKLTQAEAGRRLGLCERQVRRLETRVAMEGPASLRSRQRGRPSNRRLAVAVATQVCGLIHAHYRDFGPTLAGEYLAERHGIRLSKETLRQLMIATKLWRPKRGPQARLYALRERRPRFGELIQVDGSAHDWFEQRGPRCCLLVFIDDATSRLTQLLLVPQEFTLGYMQALYGHIREHGLPMALYSDRHGIFRVNHGDARDDRVSQFGRALASLGIEGVCATSPQAKGRVERANATLQDRLVKALRIAGIDSIEAANAWLPTYLARHNARFAVAAADPADAHVPHQPADDGALRRTLALHFPRTLSRNLTCQFHSTLLQVHCASGGAGLRGAKVVVLQHFDQSCEILWRQRVLPHHVITKPRAAPPEQDRKQVLSKPRSVPQPRNHPWKTTQIGPRSPEFIVRSTAN